MPQQVQEKMPITFHDVAACFSKEEWKLLHEWQNELYKNVMKEVYQVLISLGPLIAASVFSLRENENEDMCSMEHEDSQRRHSTDLSPREPMTNSTALCELNREENPQLKNLQDSEGEERNDCVITGKPMTNSTALCELNREENPQLKNLQDSEGEERNDCVITGFLNNAICLREDEGLSVNLVDHPNAEVRESDTSPSSGTAGPLITAVFSLRHQEEESYFQEEPEVITTVAAGPVITSVFSVLHQEHDTHFQEESGVRTTGNGTLNRKENDENDVKSTEKNTPCIASLGNGQIVVLQNCEKRTQSTSQPSPECNQELEGEETTICESGFSYPVLLSKLQQETFKVGRSAKNNECENNLRNTELLVCQQNTQHSLGQYTCGECGTNFNTKGTFVRHQKTHTGQQLYQCTECEKSFYQKANVLRHQRTHTGVKPFQCTECEKRFIQKSDLRRHQRTHTGDRPYKCTVCEKKFGRKGNLITHKKKHTGERTQEDTTK